MRDFCMHNYILVAGVVCCFTSVAVSMYMAGAREYAARHDKNGVVARATFAGRPLLVWAGARRRFWSPGRPGDRPFRALSIGVDVRS